MIKAIYGSRNTDLHLSTQAVLPPLSLGPPSSAGRGSESVVRTCEPPPSSVQEEYKDCVLAENLFRQFAASSYIVDGRQKGCGAILKLLVITGKLVRILCTAKLSDTCVSGPIWPREGPVKRATRKCRNGQ